MSVQMTLFWKALTFLRAVDIFDYFLKSVITFLWLHTDALLTWTQLHFKGLFAIK